MDKIRDIEKIVSSKVSLLENHKIKKLQEYTKDQIDCIFQKFND